MQRTLWKGPGQAANQSWSSRVLLLECNRATEQSYVACGSGASVTTHPLPWSGCLHWQWIEDGAAAPQEGAISLSICPWKALGTHLMQCHECTFLLIKNTVFCFMLDWTCNHPAKMGPAKVQRLHASFFPWSQNTAHDKTLVAWVKLGCFQENWRCQSGFGAQPCSLMHWGVFFLQTHLCPSFPPRKQTATQLLSGQIPRSVML